MRKLPGNSPLRGNHFSYKQTAAFFRASADVAGECTRVARDDLVDDAEGIGLDFGAQRSIARPPSPQPFLHFDASLLQRTQFVQQLRTCDPHLVDTSF